MKTFIYMQRNNRKQKLFRIWVFESTISVNEETKSLFPAQQLTVEGWIADKKKKISTLIRSKQIKTCTTKPTACLQSSTLRHWLQSIYWCFVIGSKWLRLECTVPQISSATAPAPHFSRNAGTTRTSLNGSAKKLQRIFLLLIQI